MPSAFPSPVVCMTERMRVREIIDILENCPHNGFPIVSVDPEELQRRHEALDELRRVTGRDDVDISGVGSTHYGKLKGIMLRQHILQLLACALWDDAVHNLDITWENFTAHYPSELTIADVHIMDFTKDTAFLDFRPYMNPAPTTIRGSLNATNCFEVFRLVGLRHMVVINDSSEVIGIITRKDFYRLESHDSFIFSKTPIVPNHVAGPEFIQQLLEWTEKEGARLENVSAEA